MPKTKTSKKTSNMAISKQDNRPLQVLSSIFLCLILVILIRHQATESYQESNQAKRHRHQLVAEQLSPVIFIPGDGGSQLEAKLNKTEKVHYVCDLVSDWFDIWLNLHLLLPPGLGCTVDNLMLYYNRTDRTTYNTPGVEIRATNFSSLDSVDYLDIGKYSNTAYFHSIIADLEKNNNLVADVSMLGAPYDFRKAPNELEEFFANLSRLIEDAYITNNYQPVTLICHSMGCLNSLYLLNRQTQNWKDVFIRRLITLGSPWHGSFKAISAMLFGDNLGVFIMPSSWLQPLQASFPSLMYLFPRAPTFGHDRVLVETPTLNYTLSNLDQLFKDKGMLDQMEMWHDTRSIADNLKAPNVELWCLYGNTSTISTPSKIIFTGSLNSTKYSEVQGFGDGTVNLESSEACKGFAREQEKPVFTKLFQNTDHIDILRKPDAANYISNHIITGQYDIKPEPRREDRNDRANFL